MQKRLPKKLGNESVLMICRKKLAIKHLLEKCKIGQLEPANSVGFLKYLTNLKNQFLGCFTTPVLSGKNSSAKKCQLSGGGHRRVKLKQKPHRRDKYKYSGKTTSTIVIFEVLLLLVEPI